MLYSKLKLAVFSLLPLFLGAQTPFDCNGRIFRVVEKQSGSVFQEIFKERGTENFTFEDLQFYPNLKINGIGYHPSQNLIYGVLLGKEYKLCRIDADYHLEELRSLPLPKDLLFVSGDISPDERYLVLLGFSPNETANLLALVDLTTPDFATQIIPVSTTARQTSSIYCADIAFHPTTGELYGFDHRAGKIITIDIYKQLIDNSRYPASEVLRGNVPTLFFDAFGHLYGIGSPSSGYATNRYLYRFDLENGRVIFLEALNFESNQDGCSCPYQVRLLNRVSHRKAARCTEIYFWFTLINRTDLLQTGLEFRDTFPPYTVISEILDLPPEWQVDSGIGSNVLSISNINLPVGIDSFQVVLFVEERALPETVYNRAFLNGVLLSSEMQTELIHSDDPATPIPNDPTYFRIGRLELDFSQAAHTFCMGDTLWLKPRTSGSSLQFQWNTGATTESIAVNRPGTYSLTVSSGCDKDSSSIQIEVTQISLDLGMDLILEKGQAAPLQARVASTSPIRYYHWEESPGGSLDCLTCPAPLVRPLTDTEYFLEIGNEAGCRASDAVRITVEGFRLFAPNAFSPNGDGRNGTFFLQGRSEYLMKSFRVFDRWGNLVFQSLDGQTNEASAGWDGKTGHKQAPAGVYVWVAEVRNQAGLVELLSGEVVLVR